MPTAEARVPTDRASRYLTQLCRHTNQMGRMRHAGSGPQVRHTESSDTTGTVHFGQGTCTLTAEPDALILRVDADDETTLRQLQDGITRRLETIGRRDRLTVTWPASDPPAGTAPTPAPHGRGRWRTLGIVAVAALAVLIHVGLLGGGLAASAWANWGTNIILVLVALKVITVGAHLFLGRAALRRRHRRTIEPQ